MYGHIPPSRVGLHQVLPFLYNGTEGPGCTSDVCESSREIKLDRAFPHQPFHTDGITLVLLASATESILSYFTARLPCLRGIDPQPIAADCDRLCRGVESPAVKGAAVKTKLIYFHVALRRI